MKIFGKHRKDAGSSSSQPAYTLEPPRQIFDLPAPPAPFAFAIPENSGRSPELTYDFEQLTAALAAHRVQITLGEDIIVTSSLLIDYNVAINFNGHSLISEQNHPDARIFDIRRGEITLTGQGKIFAMGEDSVAVRVSGAISAGSPDYTVVTIDDGVRIFAPEGTGLMVAPILGAAYGVVVDFRGQIIAKEGITIAQGVQGMDSCKPIVRLRSGSNVIADEQGGIALNGAGVGCWQIEAAKIIGHDGFVIAAGQAALSYTEIQSSGPALNLLATSPHALSVEIERGSYYSSEDAAIAGTEEGLRSFQLSEADLQGVRETPIPMPLPKPEPAPSPKLIETDERAALRDALSEALKDMRQIQPESRSSKEDTESESISKLGATILATDLLLSDSQASLNDFRDAAGDLLVALDRVEGDPSLELSDAELDQLFYHGAVLQEATDSIEYVAPSDYQDEDEETDIDGFGDFESLAIEDFATDDPISAGARLDSLEPTGQWSTGVTAIDESEPTLTEPAHVSWLNKIFAGLFKEVRLGARSR